MSERPSRSAGAACQAEMAQRPNSEFRVKHSIPKSQISELTNIASGLDNRSELCYLTHCRLETSEYSRPEPP